VVRDAGKEEHISGARDGAQHRICGGGFDAPGEGKDAAVKWKAADPVEHVLGSGEDGQVRRQLIQEGLERRQALVRNQNRQRRGACAGDKLFEHHLAFGHEHAGAADEVALANVAIILDPRIARIIDRYNARHQLAGGMKVIGATLGTSR
jgi:hypothetical protein